MQSAETLASLPTHTHTHTHISLYIHRNAKALEDLSLRYYGPATKQSE